MNHLLSILLALSGVGLAVEPADRTPLQVPDGAVEIDDSRVSFPLAHKSKSADLLFKSLAGDKGYCVLSAVQASDLAGERYRENEGLQTILVKWSFLEPADEKSLNTVKTFTPRVQIKDDVLFVSTTAIDIGDAGTVAEGVFIIQIERLPEEVRHKLMRTGW